MGSKMRFLFLLGALLVLFAEVAYPQGEDYQGKRGKHGFLQGKRGKHGFFEKEDSQWSRCSSDNDCRPNCVCVHGMCGRCTMPKPDSREDYQGKRGKHGFAFSKYYQGKRGKHGFLQGKRGKHGFIRDEEDPLIRVPLYRGTKDKLYGINMGVYDQNNYKKHKSPKCTTDSDCGDGECCRIMEHRIGLTAFATCGHCDDDYQGKRGKHGFFSAGEDYQGKRGKHGFFSAGEDYQGIPLPCTVP